MSPSRPNIVFILTDDMRADDLAWMPITTRLVGQFRRLDDPYQMRNVARLRPAVRATLARQTPNPY